MKRSEMYLDILSYLDTQGYESSFLNLMRSDLKDLADNNKKVEKLGLGIADEHIPVMGMDNFYLPSMTGVNISVVTKTRTPHLDFPKGSKEGDVFLCVKFVDGPKIIHSKHPNDLYKQMVSYIMRTYCPHSDEENTLLFSYPESAEIYNDLPCLIECYRKHALETLFKASKKDEIDELKRRIKKLEEECGTYCQQVPW